VGPNHFGFPGANLAQSPEPKRKFALMKNIWPYVGIMSHQPKSRFSIQGKGGSPPSSGVFFASDRLPDNPAGRREDPFMIVEKAFMPAMSAHEAIKRR
jgi:hypothetical protein